LDRPQWQPIISVTEKKGDSPTIVRISAFKAPAGASGGMAVLVVEPKTLVLLNLVGNANLETLGQLGKALGKPGLLNGLSGKPASKSK
jgi:hypothetical protein